MSEKTLASRLLKLLYFALALGAAYLALRFLLPWLAPFLLAFLTARLLRPAVRFLHLRLHFPRGLASALCCTLTLALLAGALGLILGRLVYELTGLAGRLPQMLARLPDLGSGLEEKLYKWVIAAPLETQEYLLAAINSVLSAATRLPEKLYEWVLSLLSTLVNGAPGALLAVAVYTIGLYLISGSYDKICAFLAAQIPPRFRRGARNMKKDMRTTLGRWLKTQAILMGISFLELTLAFLLLGIPYSILAALGIALLDALPVLGAGIVLAPWGLYRLLLGDYGQGAALLGLWAVVALVREAVEPKLLGSQIGLHPAATLLAMYVGFRAVGMAGMILSPPAADHPKTAERSGGRNTLENRKLKNYFLHPALLAGALAGTANGLFGAGGGMILIPFFTACCGLDQRRALATSVAVTLPLSALSALIYRLKGTLDLSAALPYALGGAIGGFLAGKLMGRLPAKLLRRVFALFLLYGAVRTWL